MSIAGNIVFPRNSKTFFSPFALKIMSFFIERMDIAVVCISLIYFNLMGATASNVLEKIVSMLLVISSSSCGFMGKQSS